MEQLFYHDELKSFSEVPLGDAEVKDSELELAVQLISQATSETFQPDKYSDEVRERTLELIQKKIDGEDITQIEAEEAERPDHRLDGGPQGKPGGFTRRHAPTRQERFQ